MAKERKTQNLTGSARVDAIFALPEAKKKPALARRLAYSSGLTVKEVKAKLSK